MRARFAALFVLAGCAAAPVLEDRREASTPLSEEDLRVYPEARGMPADVQQFIVRYEDCQHWLGEPEFDEERRRQVAHAVAATCPGVDAQGERLRARHAGNPAVIARLRGFEPLGQ